MVEECSADSFMPREIVVETAGVSVGVLLPMVAVNTNITVSKWKNSTNRQVKETKGFTFV